MNGIVGLLTLRSKSVRGLSSVVMIFEDGTELMPARQLVQERLTRVATTLPTAAHAPVILSPLSSLSRVLKIRITSERLSQMELTTLAKWTIRPRLSYRHLQDVEGMPFGPELVLRGAEERLAPILMTALATGLALVPIVAGGSRSGQEVEHPMAVVILGGLFTSTILNLFLLPAIFLRYGGRPVARPQ